MERRKFIVTLRQKIKVPFRSKEETIDRQFTIYAKTKRGALSSIRSAGHKGTVVEIK